MHPKTSLKKMVLFKGGEEEEEEEEGVEEEEEEEEEKVPSPTPSNFRDNKAKFKTDNK